MIRRSSCVHGVPVQRWPHARRAVRRRRAPRMCPAQRSGEPARSPGCAAPASATAGQRDGASLPVSAIAPEAAHRSSSSAAIGVPNRRWCRSIAASIAASIVGCRDGASQRRLRSSRWGRADEPGPTAVPGCRRRQAAVRRLPRRCARSAAARAARPTVVRHPFDRRPGTVHAEERAQVHAGMGGHDRAWAEASKRTVTTRPATTAGRCCGSPTSGPSMPPDARARRPTRPATHLVLDLDPPGAEDGFGRAVAAALPRSPSARRPRPRGRGEDEWSEGRPRLRAHHRPRIDGRRRGSDSRLGDAPSNTIRPRRRRRSSSRIARARCSSTPRGPAEPPWSLPTARSAAGRAGLVPTRCGTSWSTSSPPTSRSRPRSIGWVMRTRGPRRRCRHRSASRRISSRGHEIPARVAAMHEGKRRKRAAEKAAEK